MHMQTKRSKRSFALLGGLAIILAGCGSGAPADTPGGPAATSAENGDSGESLAGAELTVGSKEFTEQLILGQITIQVLEDAGATVEDQTGLVGSTTVREALLSGEIDMYWEYTGTGWITHLGNTEPVVGSEEQFEAVAEADAANDVKWLEPAPFNNTYAIAMASEESEESGISSLSDMAAYAEENRENTTLCAAAEFLTRDDGLPGLEDAYGFEVPDENISELELGLVYPSVDEGEPCIFGEVFATDGRIAALDLAVLEDDQNFFPSYLPALNVRQEVFDQHPQIADLFAPIAEALDTETMQTLNARVDVDGEDPADVARDWLEENGFIGG